MSLNPFPGPQPYRAADRHRFHGREELSRKLLGSILAHRAVTVFGPSGAGKSSLMQASVIPQLIDEHQFRVVRVDSWPEQTKAATWLAEAMIEGFKLGFGAKGAESDPKPQLFNQEAGNKESTTAASVLNAAQRAARKSARPFLIYLDQVEQLLFHNRGAAEMDEFVEVLHGLAELPIQGLKLVLSLREDYLGPLRDRLEGRMVLLDHGFRVGPMRVGELAEAMSKVAATGEPPQTWTMEETRALVMQVRVDGQAARNEAEAQAAFAQIVCRAIFDQRASGQTASATSENLDVAKILEGYLETTLSGLGELGELAQMLLEKQLITPDGSRTLRTEKELLASIPADALQTILVKLESAAILRAEEHQGRRYFELGHDWLGKQVLARIVTRQREAEELLRMSALQKSLLEKEKALQAQAGKFAKSHFRLRTVTILVVLTAIALLFLSFPLIRRSYLNNQGLEQDSKTLIRGVHAIDWSNLDAMDDKLEKLEPMLRMIEKLETQQRNGVPLSYGLGLYKGDEVLRSLRAKYSDALKKAFVLPCKTKLEEKLRAAKGKQYLRERTDLKTYLMMSDVKNLDINEETRRLTDLWFEILKATSSMAEFELKEKLTVHVRYYLELVQSGKVTPPAADVALVNKIRETLKAVPVQERYYEIFINSLNDERYDDAGEDTFKNRKYPPLILPDIFLDKPDALKFITSAKQKKDGRFKEVEGPYTEKGHYVVVLNVANAAGLLESEQWVIPLGPEEQGDRIPINLKRLSEDYDQRYIEQWSDFLEDITINPPATVKEAIDLYSTLVRPPWAYLQILRQVDDNTQWKKSKKGGAGVDKEAANKMLKQKLAQGTGGLRIMTDVDVTTLGERLSTVPSTFAKLISFSQSETKGNQTVFRDTPLQAYINILTELRRTMEQMPQPPTPTDVTNLKEQLADTAKKVEVLLQPLDKRAQSILRPWLMNPLRIEELQPTPSRRP